MLFKTEGALRYSERPLNCEMSDTSTVSDIFHYDLRKSFYNYVTNKIFLEARTYVPVLCNGKD